MCIYMMGLVRSCIIGCITGSFVGVIHANDCDVWYWNILYPTLECRSIVNKNIICIRGSNSSCNIYAKCLHSQAKSPHFTDSKQHCGVVNVNTYEFGVRNSFIHLVHAHTNIYTYIFVCILYVEKQPSDSSLRSLVLFPAHYVRLLYTLTSDTTATFTPAYNCYCSDTEVTIRWVVSLCSIHVWFTNDCVKWWTR